MGELRFSVLEMRSITPGGALVLGKFELKRDAKAGGDASGHFSLILRKSAAGWRIIHDHTS
jgi:ketosteroid isomerase-like protein